MGGTVLYLATSLDGFIAGENDDISWLFEYSEVDYGYDEFFPGIGAIVHGRRAHDQEILHGWENAHPVPTFVLSHRGPERRPERPDVVFTDADFTEVLREVRQLTGKNVWIEGGANVAQQFLSRRLIDDIVVTLALVILGAGIRLFGDAGNGFRSRW